MHDLCGTVFWLWLNIYYSIFRSFFGLEILFGQENVSKASAVHSIVDGSLLFSSIGNLKLID